MDERLHHEAARLLHDNVSGRAGSAELRRVLREQALIVRYHGPAIVDALPVLLRGTPARTLQATARFIEQLLRSSGAGLTDEGEQALARVLDALAVAAQVKPKPARQTTTSRRSPRANKKDQA